MTAVDDTKVERVVELTKRGMTANQIADSLQICQRTVERYRVRAGIADTSTSRRLTAEQLDMARNLLEDGCSYNETARTVGCGSITLRRRFPGMGMGKSTGWRVKGILQ